MVAVAGARKEQIVLENKKGMPTESPNASGCEDAEDDDDDYESDQDGSESDDDSGEEGEKGRYTSLLNTPMTDMSAIQVANSNETGMASSTSETAHPIPPLTMQLTGDQPDAPLDDATISSQTVEQVVAREAPMASSMIETNTLFSVPPLTLQPTQSAENPVDDSV